MPMKKLTILILFLGLFSCGSSRTETVAVVVEPAEFQQKLQKQEVQLIDVRTPEEFAEGHLEGAVNIDFLSEDFLEKVSKLNKRKPVMLYCRSGNRSGKATIQLHDEGFRNITDLKGGYQAWEEFIKE